MSVIRRSRGDIRKAILRVENEPLETFEAIADSVRACIAGHIVKLSVRTLDRWATEGRLDGDGRRVWLDAIKRGPTWVTSREAISRFVAAVGARAGAKTV